ncbi:MAG TPA: hypothetical protein VMV93_07345 [Chloroflexota bacterium]|nr:hypothetical protein [Chloroflexota bacterium]
METEARERLVRAIAQEHLLHRRAAAARAEADRWASRADLAGRRGDAAMAAAALERHARFVERAHAYEQQLQAQSVALRQLKRAGGASMATPPPLSPHPEAWRRTEAERLEADLAALKVSIQALGSA